MVLRVLRRRRLRRLSLSVDEDWKYYSIAKSRLPALGYCFGFGVSFFTLLCRVIRVLGLRFFLRGAGREGVVMH